MSTTIGTDSPTTRVYRSAVDLWLIGALSIAPVVVVASGVWELPRSTAGGIALIGWGLGIGLLIVLLSVPCRYTLTERTLFIRCGFHRQEVPLAAVVRAEKSAAMWSAPALSLRRVRIVLTNGSCLISPRDRDRFIAEIETLAARARRG